MASPTASRLPSLSPPHLTPLPPALRKPRARPVCVCVGGDPQRMVLPCSRSLWLCYGTGDLRVHEASGEGHPTLHTITSLPCPQGRGAKRGCVGREDLPASWGWPQPTGSLPTGPGRPSHLYPSTLLQLELSSDLRDPNPPTGFISLPPAHYRGNCGSGIRREAAKFMSSVRKGQGQQGKVLICNQQWARLEKRTPVFQMVKLSSEGLVPSA